MQPHKNKHAVLPSLHFTKNLRDVSVAKGEGQGGHFMEFGVGSEIR